VVAGTREVTAPTDLAFRERIALVRDSQGHLWWIHQRVEDVDPSALGERLAETGALDAMDDVRRTLTTELFTTFR
jgi:PhnB protein